MGTPPPNPCQEPEVLGFPTSLSLCDKGYDVVSTVHSGLKCKLRFTKNRHAFLAISTMPNPAQRAHGSNPPSPCQEPEVLGFPASLSLLDKGYDVVSTVHSDFKTQMAFHEKWARAPCDFRFPSCRIPHSGRMAPIPQAPAKNLRFFGFPASLSLLDKGYDIVSTVHSGFETQMAFHEKWACAPCGFRFPPC